MSLLQAIGAWFEAQELGELGADLFLHERPSRPVALTVLDLDEGGGVDLYRPLQRPVLRCVVREDTAEEALAKAEAVFDRLHGRENFPLGEGWWCYLAQGFRVPRLLPAALPNAAGPGALAECGFGLLVRRDQ
jgi:hypothetical protein